MFQSKLIVFEGPDGVGKTTLLKRTCEYMDDANIKYQTFSFPGKIDGTLGSHIYYLHHNWKSIGINSLHPASLQTLHIAAHIDAIESHIIPSLQSGYNVLLDRYWWSTWVYGLVSGVKEDSVKAMVKLEMIHWSNYLPDALFYIRNSSPIRDDVVDENWYELLSCYDRLAYEQKDIHPVYSINTNRSENDTFRAIHEIIRELNR
jgi:thymidylate kinase